MTHSVEVIDEDLASRLNKKVASFTLFFLTLDKSNDRKETGEVFGHDDLFMLGVMKNHKLP